MSLSSLLVIHNLTITLIILIWQAHYMLIMLFEYNERLYEYVIA
jgi:hypothetical protein